MNNLILFNKVMAMEVLIQTNQGRCLDKKFMKLEMSRWNSEAIYTLIIIFRLDSISLNPDLFN